MYIHNKQAGVLLARPSPPRSQGARIKLFEEILFHI